MRFRQSALIVAVALLVSACGSRDKVFLLPQDDGSSSGAVALLDSKGGTHHVINRHHTEVHVSGNTVHKSDAVAPAQIEKQFGALIQHLPAAPKNYILYFREGTVKLTPKSAPSLKALFADVGKRPGADVQVTGHTDTLGSQRNNDRLPKKRAEEIRRLLIDRGLEPGLVRAVGRGERELLVKTPDRTRHAKNRRVVVTVR